MTILLIEDDSGIADIVTRGLSAEGYRVSVATDGTEGLEAAKAANIELIILDLLLPGIPGKDVCKSKSLRAVGVNKPILMLTALDSVEDIVDGLRAGADDYMSKPFSFDELLARIEALNRRPTQYNESTQILKVFDLVLDRATHEVRRDNQHLSLTATEFALLEFMMSQPGKVLSQSAILEHVWGMETDPLTNIVQVYISRLRQKVDEGQTVPLIQTIRGFGYQIAVPPDV